ncbi:hypothetical protein EOM09_08045 [bacterium]|nr:hypothetical protein [bacterium]
MGKTSVTKKEKTSFEGVNSAQLDLNLSGSLWKMFDIPLFSRDINQVLNILDSKLALKSKRYWIATVNPEFIMATLKDKEFAKILTKTNLNVMDGIGLIWARELDRRSSNKLINGIKISGVGSLENQS